MKAKRIFLSLLFVFGIAVPALSVAQPAATVSANADCETRLLGIPPWYRGLTTASGPPDCNIKSPSEVDGAQQSDKLRNYIILIVLNIIEMAVVITGYIAAFFILYAGFTFVVNGSTPAGVEKARHTILNAIIGLAIALGAIAVLNLIFGVITS